MPSDSQTQSADLPAIVLLVEDEPLIAMTAEMMLEDIGIQDIRIAHNVVDAMAVLDGVAVAFALLDYQLHRETSEAVAERLLGAGIPFVFASGQQPPMTGICAQAATIMKPYTIRDLRRVLVAGPA